MGLMEIETGRHQKEARTWNCSVNETAAKVYHGFSECLTACLAERSIAEISTMVLSWTRSWRTSILIAFLLPDLKLASFRKKRARERKKKRIFMVGNGKELDLCTM